MISLSLKAEISITETQNPIFPKATLTVVEGSKDDIVDLYKDFKKIQKYLLDNPRKIQNTLSKDVVEKLKAQTNQKEQAIKESRLAQDEHRSSLDAFRSFLISQKQVIPLITEKVKIEKLYKILDDFLSKPTTIEYTKPTANYLFTQVEESRKKSVNLQVKATRFSEDIQSTAINELVRNENHVFNGRLVRFLHGSPILPGNSRYDSSFFDVNNQILVISKDQIDDLSKDIFGKEVYKALLNKYPKITYQYIYNHELAHTYLVDNKGEIFNTNINYYDLTIMGDNRKGASKQFSENFADIFSVLYTTRKMELSEDDSLIFAHALMDWRDGISGQDLKHYTTQSISQVVDYLSVNFMDLHEKDLVVLSQQILKKVLDDGLRDSVMTDDELNLVLHPSDDYSFYVDDNPGYSIME